MAFIPPSLDQVLVGSIERSRHPDLKAAFLIGATQGQFPVPVSLSGILTDEDRQSAASAGFSMAPGSAQKLIERQYLAYIALTRPSQFLCVTYPLVDQKGSPQVRSQFLDELESLFENLEEEPMKGDESSVAGFCSEPELAEFLCTRLGRDSPADTNGARLKELDMLLEQMCDEAELGRVGHHVKAAINYNNRAELEKAVVDELFGSELTGSATRLATFAACPYKYFARYSLQLQERREFKFEPLDLGAFYHRVLDSLQRRVSAEKKDFASIGEGELLALLREQIDELVGGDSFISNFVHRSQHNAFIIHSASQVLEDCVLAVAQMVRAGDFRPAFSELCFGDIGRQNDSLGCYTIELSGGRVLSMAGKIDRVDIFNAPGKTSAIVLDYKLSPRSFDWAQFFHGLDMQLAIYMLALRRWTGPKYGMLDTAGAFYIPIDVKPKKAELDDLAGRADSFDYKARGLFDGRYAAQLDKNAQRDSAFYNFYVTNDGQPYGSYNNRGALKPAHFEKILEFTEDKMARLAEQILAGKIDVKPYRLGTSAACTNCKYKVVCRFDWQINGYNLLDKLSKSSVLKRLGQADG
jgi:ATP-dependent helicase/nuclease subunit B